jgi:D-alanyl-D-alanine carboxypeptidase/D-alanyl-D-alanine-endopeptidase (penicillin-binding protein 4)
MKSIKISLFLLFSILTSCSRVVILETPPEPPTLSDRIDALLDDPVLENAIVGVCVHSMQGDTIYEKNATTSLMPASNLKLLTTAVALKTRGPDYQFSTRLYFNGAIQDSIFYGDLILRGGGDPSFVWLDSLDGVPQFQSFARDVFALGIREIHGRLVGDDNYFDDQPYGIGWSWENEPFYFQPELSALSINNNCVDIVVRGDSLGQPAIITCRPPFPTISVTNKSHSSTFSDIVVERQDGTNHFIVKGPVARGSTLRRRRTIHNPTQSAVELFGLSLKKLGIACESIYDIDDLEPFLYNPDSTLYLDIKSPPLCDIVTGINKESKNLDAELLLKCIGADMKNIGSSESGAGVILDSLQSWGVSSDYVKIVDGSGLSRKNLLTPSSLVGLLKHMRSDSVFYNSLPISGIDGTLDRQYWTRDPNLRAKTGTLDYIKALSGYITTSSGDELAFSFIVNHHLVDTKKISYIQDRMCRLLAQQ